MKKLINLMLTGIISVTSFCQSHDITGKIVNQKSVPIPNASIFLLNTNRGSVTDANGSFHFKNLPAGKYQAVISSIGYASLNQELETGKQPSNGFRFMLAEASKSLEAVLVSAEKKDAFLQQVPLSITAISSKKINEFRLWNSRDITAIVPNLYSASSGDDRNVTGIRGIATTSYDPAVATYIDGVNQFSLDTYIAQLSDIERIEVLRGPQGTLYGRNAMGGVINIISKQPGNKLNGFAELSAGNYGQQRYSAGIRTALIKNKLFMGISGVFDQRDGYYTNAFNNRSFDDKNSLMGNYYIKFTPCSKWSFSLNVKHVQNRNDGAFPLVNGVEDAFINPYVLNQDAVARMIDNSFNSSLSVNFTGKKFNFSSQTAYQDNYRYYEKPLDGDFSPIDGVTIINNFGDKWNKVKVLTQEIKFSNPAASSSKLKWTAGTYLFHQDNPTKQAVRFGNDALLVGAPDVNFSTINSTKGKSKGIAFFGQATLSVTPKLHIIAGLRYDNERKEYNVLGQYQKDPDPNPQFDTRPDTSAAANFQAFSPKLGLSYSIHPNNQMFITYSRGFRTGGVTALSSDPSQPPLFPYDPEYSNNFEAGIKNTFMDKRLQVNLTLFYTTVTGAQVPTLVLPDAVTITKNAGKLNSRGIELELSAAPVKGLQVDYHFGYTDASYKSLKLSQNGSVADLNGKRQLFTPEETSMLALQYGYAVGKKHPVRFTVRTEWFYIGEQYFNLSNTIRQSGYNLFHVRAGVTARNISLFFWGRNLSDRKYIAYAYDFGAVHLGTPKTYGATLSYNF